MQAKVQGWLCPLTREYYICIDSVPEGPWGYLNVYATQKEAFGDMAMRQILTPEHANKHKDYVVEEHVVIAVPAAPTFAAASLGGFVTISNTVN